MSLLACRRVGARGKVIAFEPSLPLVEFLNHNKKVNGFSQFQIVSKAVADSVEQKASFYLKDGGDSFPNSLVPDRYQNPANPSSNTTSIPIETTTLDAFCQETQFIPAAIKIDVEGAELLVLQGARALLKHHRPILGWRRSAKPAASASRIHAVRTHSNFPNSNVFLGLLHGSRYTPG
jgi:FkbM family methyltransferase